MTETSRHGVRAVKRGYGEELVPELPHDTARCSWCEKYALMLPQTQWDSLPVHALHRFYGFNGEYVFRGGGIVAEFTMG